MNVEECYTKIGGSYATAVRLFKTDERIIKYFKIMTPIWTYSVKPWSRMITKPRFALRIPSRVWL